MTPETELTPGEERRLGRVLDAWQLAPTRPGLGLAIALAARPKAPRFGWTWPRLATLAAAACLGLVIGWIEGGESLAGSLDSLGDVLFFPGDTIDGDFT